MTDISQTPDAAPTAKPKGGSLFQKDARTKRRNAAESRFKMYGIAAIGIGLLMLIVLVTNIYITLPERKRHEPVPRDKKVLPFSKIKRLFTRNKFH